MNIRVPVVCGLLLSALSLAQEYRGTILGVVTDPSGAAVPQAEVTITNQATGVAVKLATNAEGNYVVPFLLPGGYGVRVEKAGFKATERKSVELRVADRMRVDIMLQVGQATEQITVTAEVPLLEVSSSNRGQVIEARQITDLPLAAKNTFRLVDLAAGVQYSGSMNFARPFDVGGSSSFQINGGRPSQNEFQIDGVPDNSTSEHGAAYVPPIEATQEFKVQTNTYDAQYGRTSGGVISVSIKPGTNQLHGAAYEYLRRTALNANTSANNGSGQARPSYLADQYGFELDGPVMLPKYRGKDRTFFMFAMERYRDQLPRTALGAVPTAAQREGDFSQTFTAAGKPYVIYDPLTIQPNPGFISSKAVSLTNPQYLRTPFAGNRVPQARMQQIALNVLKDIPLPNQEGHPITHLNNWLGGNVTEDNDFQSLIARVDHTFNNTWKMYARWNKDFRDGGRIDYNGWGTPASQYTHSGARNDGAVLDVVGTLSPSTIFTGRLGFNRVQGFSVFKPQDISALGLPKTLASQLQLQDKYPVFTFTNYMQAGRDEARIRPAQTYTAQAGMVKIHGAHTMKYGFEYRHAQAALINRTNAAGAFNFTRGWTSANPQVDDPNTGNAIASFLLGYLGSANATLNAMPFWSWGYPVLYYQDDWQVTRRLTLNLGVRWDYEMAPLERYDRQNRGFDFDAKSPYQVPGMDLRGGLLFAGVGGQPRRTFDPDRNNWQPRAGLAYKVLNSRPLVFRAGFGRYYLPTTADVGTMMGFTQQTNAITGTAEYQPVATISNPFPDGLIQPAGASQGLATDVGQSVTFNDPHRTVPYVWQFSAGFQYELTPGLLMEVSYAGSRTRELAVSKSLTYLTEEQLALGTAYLSQSVPNPFYGVLPALTSRGAQPTTQRRSLMLPYTQFSGLTQAMSSVGTSWYNSLQFKLEKRFRHGLSLLVSYTNSKNMEAVSYLRAQDTALDRELNATDAPQRLILNGIYEFPIGPKKRWVGSGLLSHIVGGWQLGWTALVQSGYPITYPDYTLLGDPKLKSGQTLDRWFDTSKEMWVQRLPDTLRTLPLRSPNIRRHTAPQLDTSLIRNFHIREGHRMQVKVSAYNTTNTPIFNFPNTSPSSPLFGVVPVTQINQPRSIEMGFRYAF